MSTLLGTDADETILPGNISPTVTAVAGPLVVGADSDVIIAGGGDDHVNGGGGNDTMLLGAGNDLAFWNPGDGSDVVDGGTGMDTLEFNGSGGNEHMQLRTLTDGVIQLTRDLGNINMTLQGLERVGINAADGDDVIEASGDLASLIKLTVDGGGGNDRIIGSNGDDLLLGGDGNDFIDGQQGADTAFMGAGDDTFQWDPGDGSDVVEGQAGRDTMLFNGSNAAEIFEISADGERARFTRNVGNIVMDLDDVETVDLLALGGADSFIVNGLTATDVRNVSVNLAEATAAADTVTLQGRAAGTDFHFANRGASLVASGLGADIQVLNAGAEDRVLAQGAVDAGDEFLVDGGNGGENFQLGVDGTDLIVDGLGTRIAIRNASLAADSVVINGNAGDDTFEATGNIAPLAHLVLDGGAGNDRILGSNGDDVLLGGEGNDFIDGQQGADVAFMGAGDDIFQWDPGDGSDVVEGQAGRDTMLFNGSNAAEIFEISANGERARFTRNVGTITMDLNDVEVVELVALGGADTLLVNDLTATDVREVKVDLAEAAAAADTVLLQGRATGTDFAFTHRGATLVASGLGAEVQVSNAGTDDTVVANGVVGADDDVLVEGGAAAEDFQVSVRGNDVLVNGLGTTVAVRNVADAIDSLRVSGGAGNDTLAAAGNLAPLVNLVMDGGAGDDRILGGNGADVLIGGDGNDFVDGQQGADTASLGAGNDLFQWDPGDGSDVIDGGTGFDTHLFNGSNGAENFALVANGGRATLTRNLGNIVMDQDNFESVEINALGGADQVRIDSLRGTDVREVAVDFAGTIGGDTGDGIGDSASVIGSSRSEIITLQSRGDDVIVNGTSARTTLANLDAMDSVTVDGSAGNDIIAATSVAAGTAQVTLLGGAGNDTLLAGRGGMTLSGGAGNDLLIGNTGDDVLVAGSGRDVVFGGGGDDLFSGDDDFTVLDFHAGAGSADRIDLRNVAGIEDFGDVLAHARLSRLGVVLDFGDDEITLLGVSASQLQADDFVI